MRSMKTPVRFLAALALTLGAGACATHTQSSNGITTGVEGSRVKVYDTPQQLMDDSALVVEANALPGPTVVPADEEGASGLDSTVTRVQITSVVSGSGFAAGDTVAVRQLGTAQDATNEFSPILTADQPYLLFLTKFEFDQGKPTDQWVITGDAGELAPEASGPSAEDLAPETSGNFVPLSPAVTEPGSKFPSVVTVASLESLTKTARTRGQS